MQKKIIVLIILALLSYIVVNYLFDQNISNHGEIVLSPDIATEDYESEVIKLTQFAEIEEPTPTPIPIKLLTSTQLNLLTNKLNSETCRLPCFLDILPGQTNWTEATKKMISLGAEFMGRDGSESGNSFRFIFFAGSNSYHVILEEKNSIVQKITFKTYSKKNDSYYIHLANYSIFNFLKFYGKPDQIFIKNDEEFNTYGIIMVYKNIKTYIHWTAKMQKKEVICPNEEDNKTWIIDFNISSQKNDSDFNLYTSNQEKFNTKYGWRPILSAFNINEESFNSQMIANNSSCFTLYK